LSWGDDDGKPNGYEWGDEDESRWDPFGWLKDQFVKRTTSPSGITSGEVKIVKHAKRAPYCPPCPKDAVLKPGNGALCCNIATTTTRATTLSSTVTSTFTSTLTRTKVSKVTVTATGNSTRLRQRSEVDSEYRDFIAKQTVPNDRTADIAKIDKPQIAIVTFMTQAGKAAYHSLQDYKMVFPMTTYSMKQYADKHGYSLIVHTETALEQADKQAYWLKMDLILEAFSQGYSHVLYTDLDVLFMDHSKKLESFITDKDIVTSNECAPNHVSTKPTPRSGFVLFKNTPNSVKFLQLWKESYTFYEHVENPEQSAFEALLSTAEWTRDSHVHSWAEFHSYDTCAGTGSFSMHFPGREKVARVARAWVRMGEPHLREYAAGLLRKTLTNYYHDALVQDLLTEADMIQARNCLSGTREVGYDVKPYDAAFHAHVKYYLASSHITNIPTDLYLLNANAADWAALNPSLTVHAFTNADADELIRLLLPDALITEETRRDLLRWSVLGHLGGYFADGPALDFSKWNLQADDSLSLQVKQVKPVLFSEAAIAAAAMQPVIVQTLVRVESLEALTQSMAAYICYSSGHMGYTPMDYNKGGHAPGVTVVAQDFVRLPKLSVQ